MKQVNHFARLAFCAALFALSSPAIAAEKLKTVATFSILADMAAEVGGDRIEVTSLVGPNGDAHVFQPSPADAKTLSEAKLVFVNGLGLEGWLDRLVQASGAKAARIVASAGVKPLVEDEGGRKVDPHAWQDVGNAKLYAANLRDGLIAADPDGRAAYEANATRYIATLDALEGEVRAAIATIPEARRKIITTHDAFGYFGKAYGMSFIAPQGVSTESEASAKDVAKIIRQIRAQKIPAVFLENVSDQRLIARIAKEGGARIGAKVFSDALSEKDGPAPTYVEMMRNNVRAFAQALVM